MSDPTLPTSAKAAGSNDKTNFQNGDGDIDGVEERLNKRIKRGHPIMDESLAKADAVDAASNNGPCTDEAIFGHPKHQTNVDFADILDPTLLSRRDKIRQSYDSAEPFPYAQIFDIFLEEFLNGVKDEIKTQTNVSFKESDLFRVYQSIDLANLDPDSVQTQKFQRVMRLRELLYSDYWRAFMEDLSGLPPNTLTNKIDCACNCHAPGCHLLCHDDVIGTRKISYIIYLTEPDWKQEEGGALEMYNPQIDDVSDSSNADDTPRSLPIPVKRAWPIFNSMAFFVVTPGSSFHAVQEVLGDRPRLSLQGWYHARDAPPNMELATLNQLKSKIAPSIGRGDEEDVKDQKDPANSEFSDSDRQYLMKYVQPEFLTDEAMKDIQKRFENDSSVQLTNFLKPTWVPKLQPLKPFVYNDSYYSSGVSKEWKLQGPAHKQRYLVYQHNSDASDDSNVVGSLLNHVKVNVFKSEAMKRYLGTITALGRPTGINDSQVRHFRPGLDYTVAHHGLLLDESVLDATMCFVNDENDNVDAWESGDVGGFECYIEAEDNDKQAQGPADEYCEDDDTELLSVSASNNTLSLVYRDPGTMRFVKYVGSSAPSGRFDICMEYNVASEDDGESTT